MASHFFNALGELQWVLLSIQFVLATLIPDVPEEVEIQLQRQAFIVDKVIMIEFIFVMKNVPLEHVFRCLKILLTKSLP